MKNVCIVLRNKKNTVLEPDFAPIADLFLSKGYFFDEVLLLSYSEVGLLHSRVRSCMKECDLLCLISDRVLCEGVKNSLSQSLQISFDRDGIADGGHALICALPADGDGRDIAEKRAVPMMDERMHNRYDRMVVRMVGAPYGTVEKTLDKVYAVSGDAMSYNYVEKYGDSRLEVIYDSVTPKMLADRVMRVILQDLQEYVYALDDITLEERIYDALRLRKHRLAVAESFTGGRIAARMVRVPGVSSVFVEGLTVYSNEAKTLRLGVTKDLLQRKGAVSAQTAHDMAEGLFETDGCDVCVATTGIAGPGSDGTKKPVGLCYIAAGISGKIFVNEYRFSGDRECITQTAVNQALFSVFRLLQD